MIPVIDIFAGPGGLGEGFSQAGFDVKLSAEMDPVACKTLELRKFFHQFSGERIPESYYEFLRGEIDIETLQSKNQSKWAKAINGVANVELGTDSGNIKLNQKLDNILLDGENFILIGGPPCQAYSLAGRSRMLGIGNQLKISTKNTSIADIQTKLTKEFYQDKRHTLYKEYLKIICRYQPAVFVMENVKGMGSARSGPSEKAGSIFSNIIHGLRNPFDAVKVRTRSNQKPKGYKLYSIQEVEKDLFSEDEILKPEDCLVRSEQFGVPQSRHRIIIIGVRSDLYTIPRKLKPSNSTKTVRDAIGTMPKIRSGLSKEPDSCALWQEVIIEQVKEALIGQTPFDHQLKDTIVRIKKKNNELSRGARFVHGTKNVFNCFGEELENYINDPRLKGIIQHESRAHMRSDLLRYFLVSLYGEINQKSPRLTEWSGKMKLLKPKHSNIKIKQNSLSTKAHNDRFKVQIWDAPSSTIVSHIAKDGHYFIHPDTTQCRSFTVREAARLQTFPDNYYFFGNKTQQYHQVGNAVPVILARKIAETIKASLN